MQFSINKTWACHGHFHMKIHQLLQKLQPHNNSPKNGENRWIDAFSYLQLANDANAISAITKETSHPSKESAAHFILILSTPLEHSLSTTSCEARFLKMAFLPCMPTGATFPRHSSGGRCRRHIRCVTSSSSDGTASLNLSRRALLSAAASAAVSALLIGERAFSAESSQMHTSSGLSYSVTKKGEGPTAVVGDLVGIRFRGAYNGVVFDDLFGSNEPYFYRVGFGNVLKVSFWTFPL